MAKASLAGLQKEVIQLNGEITFSDDGRITNSAKVLSGLQNQINAVITEFNNSKDAAEQEILEAELEALEAHYESLEKAINQYRDTLDLIREIDQTLQENHYAL
jgi:exonuclease VII small subunit